MIPVDPRTVKRIILKLLKTRHEHSEPDFLKYIEYELRKMSDTVDWYVDNEKMLAGVYMKMMILELQDAAAKMRELKEKVENDKSLDKETMFAERRIYERILGLLNGLETRFKIVYDKQ